MYVSRVRLSSYPHHSTSQLAYCSIILPMLGRDDVDKATKLENLGFFLSRVSCVLLSNFLYIKLK